jgi:hypothetical protein
MVGEKKKMLCRQFKRFFRPDVEKDMEELKTADFAFIRPADGFWYTRECKFVYRTWNWNCAGFRKQEL